MRSKTRGLTSKVTGDHGVGEAPPMGVRVDREVRPKLAGEASRSTDDATTASGGVLLNAATLFPGHR